MRAFKECFYFLCNQISLHRGTLLSCAAASIVLVALYELFVYTYYDSHGIASWVKLADILILTAGGLDHWIIFAIMPVSAFAMLLVTRYDQSPNHLIRRQHYWRVWKSSTLKAFGVAVFLSVLVTTSAVLFGLPWTSGSIDFESTHSIFASMTDGKTMPNPPLLLVVGNFFLCSVLVLFLGNSLWVLADSISKRKWIPMLCILALALINYLSMPIILTGIGRSIAWINIDYQFWLHGKQYVFLLAIVILSVIQIVNLFLTRWREWV